MRVKDGGGGRLQCPLLEGIVMSSRQTPCCQAVDRYTARALIHLWGPVGKPEPFLFHSGVGAEAQRGHSSKASQGPGLRPGVSHPRAGSHHSFT